MRILGFSKKWSKLSNPEFTTFRFPRRDRDWEVGEQVQIVYKPRSKEREILGTAEIISKEPRNMSIGTHSQYRGVSISEAKADGFAGYWEMWDWLYDAHGGQRLVDEPMNKLTLGWAEPAWRDSEGRTVLGASDEG